MLILREIISGSKAFVKEAPEGQRILSHSVKRALAEQPLPAPRDIAVQEEINKNIDE